MTIKLEALESQTTPALHQLNNTEMSAILGGTGYQDRQEEYWDTDTTMGQISTALKNAIDIAEQEGMTDWYNALHHIHWNRMRNYIMYDGDIVDQIVLS